MLERARLVQAVGAVREKIAVFGVGDEEQPEKEHQRHLVGFGELIGRRMYKATPGEQCLGEARDRVLVDALAQAFAQFGCEAARLFENFLDRTTRNERWSGKNQPEITGFGCLNEVRSIST